MTNQVAAKLLCLYLGRAKVGIWVEIGVSEDCEICFAA